MISTYQAVSGTGKARRRAARRRRTRSLHGEDAAGAAVYAAPDRLQRAAARRQLRARRRPHRRGAQADQRDAQDPRRRSIRVSATCVRVPVVTRPLGGGQRRDARAAVAGAARELLAAAPGVTVLDDPGAGSYPMAIDAAGKDDVFVGRIRRDPGNERALDLWIVSRQPAQGRGDERRAARRAAARARPGCARARLARRRGAAAGSAGPRAARARSRAAAGRRAGGPAGRS